MNFTNREKELLLSNAPVLSRITLYAEDGTVLQVFNEDDYLVDWEYEDFRYVPDQGFIGQFVERLLDGHLMNIPDTLSLEDKEISVEIAVVDNELEEQVYHNYGRFIITKIEKEDTTGSYKFESSDYTKKFNEVYTGGVSFPCTALRLLNSACDQVGVELNISNNAQAIDYIATIGSLEAGDYAFLIDGTYYNFTLSENLMSGDLLMLKNDALILRKVTDDYKIIRKEIPYSTSETSSNTVLSDEPYDYYALINDDFIVNNNQFTENNTCRDVVRSVAQLSYTWARIDENNKLCLDFVKNDSVDSYDEIDTDKYYEATVTGDKVEPVNKVLIGMSQVEGENIVMEQDGDLLDVDKIYGETSQSETPTPSSPIPINNVSGDNDIVIEGKNLFNPMIYDTTASHSNCTADITNTTINVIPTGNSYLGSAIKYPTYVNDNNKPTCIEVKPSTTYTFSINNSGNSYVSFIDSNYQAVNTVDYPLNNLTSYIFTTPSNCKYVMFRLGKNSGTTPYTFENIQLEENETATTYEAYNGTTYNIDLPVENLCNGVVQQMWLSGTGDLCGVAPASRGLYIPVNGGKYTISTTQTQARYRVGCIDTLPSSENNVSAYNGSGHDGTSDTITIDTTGHTYLVVDATDVSKVQIETGSKKNTYTPYGTTPIELNKIGTYQDYIYKENDKWYLHKETTKVVLDGTEEWSEWNTQTQGKKRFRLSAPVIEPSSYDLPSNMFSSHYEIISGRNNYSGQVQGVCSQAGGSIIVFDSTYCTLGINAYKNWLSTHNVSVNYVLSTPTNTEIIYQPLIDQLNALQNASLFEGTNHIVIDTLNEIPSLDITVTDLEQDSTSYSGKSFEITGHDYDKGGSIYIYDNPLTYTESLRRIAINGAENLFGLTYTPVEVQSIGHPWLTGKEFMKITNLENQELYFYPFDRKISYTGVLTTDLSAQAKNEVAQKYENRNNVLDKINHTEISVDKANGTIEALSKTVNDNKEEFTQWQSTEYNSLKSTVGEIDRDLNVGNNSVKSRLSSVEQTATAITNMFQITGGINVIRNSAFLLPDEVWEFTDSGTNPYHTPLGSSYNSVLSGQTVSVAEIKARSMKIKSKSENITNLVVGTQYTFNFYHKQDDNMTTTIKMYSTENNSSKAFDDIVITGQQDFKNYDVSFTPTSYTNYTLEIIITSTSSIGYAYIYDMMLNSGDKQAWQPASDEIYSTTLQMSRLGLKVYSVGDGTITLLGSDGMSTYETTDGKTLGRLVSMRTEAGDRVKTVTSEALYLTKDIREENANRWVETIVTISGTPYKVEYIESGGQ